MLIAICEDNPSDTSILDEYITRYMDGSDYTLKMYGDGSDLLNDLHTHTFDIVFMDIVLKQDSGINLTMEVNRLQPDARIIYQSSNIEFFKSVYKTSHIYFLLKPIDFGDFCEAMDKAVKSFEKQYIVIKNKERIKCCDILYIEIINHDVVFYLREGSFVSARVKTKNLLEMLPQSFIRCQKGFIVNADHISSYNKAKKHFISENGQTIPIGIRYAEEVDVRIIKYWGESIIW